LKQGYRKCYSMSTRCKTCGEGKGLVFSKREARQVGEGNVISEEVILVPVACDCCGGWYEHCQNCEFGYRYFNWVSTDDYENVITQWLEVTVLDLIKDGVTLDYYTVYGEGSNPESVEDMYNFLKTMSFQSKQKIRKDIKVLIPGNHRKDVIVLARRTRLIMIQLLYDKGHLDLEEAKIQLNGRLSPDKPETHFDDSKLLQLKENDDAE
jgi:hypothetical protein